MKSIVIHAWSISYDGLNHYLPYTHWVYLNEIVKYYDKVSLLSPVTLNDEAKDSGFILRWSKNTGQSKINIKLLSYETKTKNIQCRLQGGSRP